MTMIQRLLTFPLLDLPHLYTMSPSKHFSHAFPRSLPNCHGIQWALPWPTEIYGSLRIQTPNKLLLTDENSAPQTPVAIVLKKGTIVPQPSSPLPGKFGVFVPCSPKTVFQYSDGFIKQPLNTTGNFSNQYSTMEEATNTELNKKDKTKQ